MLLIYRTSDFVFICFYYKLYTDYDFYFNYNFTHKQPKSRIMWPAKSTGATVDVEGTSRLNKSQDKQADEETGNQFISRPPTAADRDRVM